ncbi:DUF521 domain-containing protein [Alkalibacter rhizosphaerae]|uniref:DUF521 domain-containing protein n=1 Tax=Alkalibacter rhizosphaerae TaxID=2815577 RepID=A0A974XG45_9FIRM|nr:aconitase X catalytic domain-containing protein [Alkalibacter rhizosphaerae]QSX09237.1 DUF521 domain-containing protein [Alkalibacter rhizosphaerae]
MYLTDEEKSMLNGDHGEIKQRCMQFLVDYGEVAGAEHLIDLDGNVDLHPPYGNWLGDYDVSYEEVVELAEIGEKFKVPTFANKAVNPGMIVDGWEKIDLEPFTNPEFRMKQEEMMKPYMKMGMVPILSCNYYLVSSYTPTVGQHCAWVESSAIPWGNAVLGARTNFDGCFQTAYLGKVPAYDMHLDENRKATVLVEYMDELKTDMDYDLFGWAVGEMVGLEVPALIGVGKPTTSQLVKMNTSLNTGGQVRMYHVPGLTPEAPTLEAAFSGNYQRKIQLGRDDLRKIYDKMNYASNDQVDFVYLGCPHYNIEEILKVARLVDGKKLKATMWITTNPSSYKVAKDMGLIEIIEKAGGNVLSGTCPGILGKLPPSTVMATDAAKQNYYINGIYQDLHVWYGTTEDCVESAIKGVWQGEWK